MRFVTCLALFFVACGGKLAPTSSSGGGGVDSGGTTHCDSDLSLGTRACVPPEAPANTPLVIALDSTTECLPCGATLDPCSVEVSGKEISVFMTGRSCVGPNAICPTICELPKVMCEIPALPAGTYTVKVGNERDNALVRQLVVSDTGSSTSCDLVVPAPSIGPFDFSKYDRSCTTASDCVVVPSLLCRACACEDTAIATSARASFEADFRAGNSQCEAQPAGNCAPCLPRTAACNAGRCQTH